MKRLKAMLLSILFCGTVTVQAYDLHEFQGHMGQAGSFFLAASPVLIGVVDGLFNLRHLLCSVHCFSAVGVALSKYNAMPAFEQQEFKNRINTMAQSEDAPFIFGERALKYVAVPTLQYVLGMAIGKRIRNFPRDARNYFKQKNAEEEKKLQIPIL